ncbi:MAG: hypothetical protein KMY55_06265 [Dethiosulfatibacter sp.]|nr:hypothetical protein [Dethiosulfatibacter sp.]
MDRNIKRKRENYTDVWNSSNIFTDMGKRTGMYHIMKAMRVLADVVCRSESFTIRKRA